MAFLSWESRALYSPSSEGLPPGCPWIETTRVSEAVKGRIGRIGSLRDWISVIKTEGRIRLHLHGSFQMAANSHNAAVNSMIHL